MNERTQPPGAITFPISRPSRREWGGVEASWELETTMEWHAYREWVRGRLEGFAASPEGDRAVVLRRSVPGDAYFVRIVVISPGPPLRIRVDYHAFPD